MANLINGYTNHTITVDGVVTNSKTNKVKAQWIGKNGYLYVDIHEDGKTRKVAVHRLLALQYIPNPDNKRTVNHIDGNKLNNNLSNLEWNTDSENIQHAYDNNLNYTANKKISNEAYIKILPRFFNGESLTEIVKDYDFSLTTLSTYIEDYVKSINQYDDFVAEKKRQQNTRAKIAKHETYKVKRINKNDPNDFIIYNSLKDGMRALDKKSSGPISNVLAGRSKSAYGYFWERI